MQKVFLFVLFCTHNNADDDNDDDNDDGDDGQCVHP
jgi:hypothetical protein